MIYLIRGNPLLKYLKRLEGPEHYFYHLSGYICLAGLL